jgi:RNA polymerase sigma-70 factor (ECF subfamily)
MRPMGTEQESDLRCAWDTGDYETVVTQLLQSHARAILGILIARLKSESDADEVYSMFTEDLSKGIKKFQWRCSLRAWAIRIALNAMMRWLTAGHRRPERNVSLEDSAVLEVADRVRSSTLAYLRSEVKSEVRRLRDELPPDEQMLLILHVDKAFKWKEVAAALADEDLAPDKLKREAARLRKQFETTVKKLRESARSRGILDD